MPRARREPSHSGTWYNKDAKVLAAEIDTWLAEAGAESNGAQARAVIAPHAGYRYCGHVMAYAYRHINPQTTRRVFLLGPSHHVYYDRCVLSSATHYATPLGDLPIDQDVYAELASTDLFDTMDLDVDEAEHSLELHTPYIAHIMRGQEFTLVPVMVGAISTEREEAFGNVLAPYLDNPSNVFVISSDFCHWGARFRYQPYDKAQGAIWQYIQWLDQEGIKAIQTGDPRVFADYLAQYRNSICGRHPIGILLSMLKSCKAQHRLELEQYDQSSKCASMRDSSVSYASIIVTAAT